MASSYWQVTEEIQPQPLRLPFSISMRFLPDRNPVKRIGYSKAMLKRF
jgi:hypothetical protein